MIFRWLKARRRRKILAEPFPDSWEDILHANVRRYPTFDAQQQDKLRRDVQILAAEKYWEGCGGLSITDEVKVTLASQIAILTLGFEQQYFDHVLSVLVYPDEYVAPTKSTNEAGLVEEGGSTREGEAWHRGPVILSWADALAGAQGHTPGRNLVIHEFAHQLDMLNGGNADGIPPIETSDQAKRWIRTLDAEYEQLCDDCHDGRYQVLDCYGTTNKAEFFAVATESFFEEPRDLSQFHDELYSNLREYYRQDPRDWAWG